MYLSFQGKKIDQSIYNFNNALVIQLEDRQSDERRGMIKKYTLYIHLNQGTTRAIIDTVPLRKWLTFHHNNTVLCQ